ncbi:hypothetical protein [Bacillus cereus group sp. TH150LC]|uniref:hypothetical protein n=1 Tax=Bacillus cereus group sp. TH150LC TaxID=3018061 RepID=UPI0022E76F0F|nr:hypothetical protein [Bacillus cereus group sp. TH150LC]MDA1657920.1 hypothetical protein [Bacillus cereus group sp. TH150LC]
MKLTLFTISNEQIKEQLSKLQTKVESLETVKDVQDKIISAKDSQISFLSDQTANMLSFVSLIAAIAGIIASGAFIYISYVNRQSQKALKTAEERIHAAEEQNQRAQERINEAEELIQQANSISNLAQDKLDELEIKQKINMKFNKIKTSLDLVKERHIDDKGFCHPDYMDEFNDFIKKIPGQEVQYRTLFTELSNKIIKDLDITDNDLKNLEKLDANVTNFVNEYILLLNKSGIA